MTADKTASSKPGTPHCPMPGNRFQRVLGTRWSEAAARRQSGGNGQLISADDRSENPARHSVKKHGSPGTKYGLAPAEDLALERLEAGAVGLSSSPDDQIPRGLPLLNFPAPYLPQAAPQTIAGHRGRLKLGNYQSHPWLARWIFHPDHVQVLESAAPATGKATANVGGAHEPVGPRQALRTRQEPPCFDGSETVSCLRPFFRRRDRTARPQRVAMRARNPCLLIRRLLRGR